MAAKSLEMRRIDGVKELTAEGGDIVLVVDANFVEGVGVAPG